jgi:hypothetical protein
MEMPLELDTVYRLISSPQWTSQDSLLPTDPGIITGIHQALADHAFFPCPEPEPEMIPATPHSFPLETQNSALETPPSSLFPLSFSQASAPALELETCYFPLEINPPNQREISAKLPKNKTHFWNISEQYQINMPFEENVPKNPCVGRESEAPPADQMENIAPPAVNCPLPVESHPPATRNWQPETLTGPPADQPLETRNSKLGTQNIEPETPLPPGITPELLQQILRRLDQPLLTQPKTTNRKLATANFPPNQREISAKLPKNKPHSCKISEQYQ